MYTRRLSFVACKPIHHSFHLTHGPQDTRESFLTLSISELIAIDPSFQPSINPNTQASTHTIDYSLEEEAEQGN